MINVVTRYDYIYTEHDDITHLPHGHHDLGPDRSVLIGGRRGDQCLTGHHLFPDHQLLQPEVKTTVMVIINSQKLLIGFNVI